MSSWKLAIMGVVLGIIALFAMGLQNDPRDIPTPLISKPASDFSEPSLKGDATITLTDYRGKWVLLNFWGSWCISCVAEHPYLIQLADQVKDRDDFLIIGVDFKDTREGAFRFLQRHGDPGYQHLFDPKQRVAIDWGVYGAPESFLIDPTGIIRLKHTGPLYPGWFEKVALPLIDGGAVQ
ncbi:MAG: DsbE family thiol:disulfide interchange protein [Magnetococcales bacterium]|nr:DsbE family thiol:disulfide interchange protein [Magnetococcales bacterium]